MKSKRKVFITASMDGGKPFRLEISRNEMARIKKIRRPYSKSRHLQEKEDASNGN